MQSPDVIVHTISLASATSRSDELRTADGGALPSFEAGAHIDVRLGPSLVRPYSVCNSPREKGRHLICVRRDDAGRGGSRTLHRNLTLGRRLRISPPRNHFPLVAAEHHVLVGGGIGIKPLLSTAEALAARGASCVLHHYTSRAAEASLLERLKTSALGERAVVHHSDQGDTVRAELPPEPRVPEPDTAVHVCGPDGFMTHVVAEATAAGRHPGQLHTERLAPAAPPSAEAEAEARDEARARDEAGAEARTGVRAEAGAAARARAGAAARAAARARAGAGAAARAAARAEAGAAARARARARAKAEVATALTVRIAGTGTSYPVPADRAIDEVLTAHGVEVDLSCEQGIRGACPTPVLAGAPDHRDEVRTPAERAAGDRITICCSRARTPELLLGL
ncbi:PDR/VanB family oxidoreductase [Streptomyces sp. NPDC005648]|uniref:PDR/VanB family oxidoreductase n=1 Tax=Streptomyces sp. NPDC005648 TaxID=3157044 RepID=UPI0033B1744B